MLLRLWMNIIPIICNKPIGLVQMVANSHGDPDNNFMCTFFCDNESFWILQIRVIWNQAFSLRVSEKLADEWRALELIYGFGSRRISHSCHNYGPSLGQSILGRIFLLLRRHIDSSQSGIVFCDFVLHLKYRDFIQRKLVELRQVYEPCEYYERQVTFVRHTFRQNPTMMALERFLFTSSVSRNAVLVENAKLFRDPRMRNGW